MKYSDTLQLLKQINLFAALNNDTLKHILNTSQLIELGENTLIFHAGDAGHDAYFILKGRCEVFAYEKRGAEVIINSLSDGDYFGELALLTGTYRTASVRTVTPSLLLKMPKKVFDELTHHHISVNRALLNLVSDRLTSVLSLVRGHKHSVIILFRCHEHIAEEEKRFLDYFEQISPKPIIEMDEHTPYEAVIRKAYNTHDHYIFVKARTIDCAQLENAAHYVVDFIHPRASLGTHFYLRNASTWQIEHTARCITNKTIGIALCSGGVPGLAHVGVLRVLQANDIPLDFIAGTSAGALCGAAFAFGLLVPNLIATMIETVRIPLLFTVMKNLSFDLSGIMSGKYYLSALKQFFQGRRLEQAAIPLAVIASDLMTGETLSIKQGDAAIAVRQSISIPILIAPIKQGNKLIVDGVATKPLPVSILIDEKIDFKIAVPIPQMDLQTHIHMQSKMIAVGLRSRSIMAEQMVNESKHAADIIIEPNVKMMYGLDWKKAEQTIAAGEAAALGTVKAIKTFLYQGFQT